MFILTFSSIISYGQSIESITEKISNRICKCIIVDIQQYSEIKPEFNRCYDKEFNNIFNVVDAAEQKILIQEGALDKIKSKIIPTINSNCEKIKVLIKSEIDKSEENTERNKSITCPTNFTGDSLSNIDKLEGEIIAFNGLITKVKTAHKSKPYYEVQLEGGNTIWIASLITSKYEVADNIVRVLGFVSTIQNDKIAKKYNKSRYHVLAFCVIDMKTKQMSFLPGSELQIKDWVDGKIPSAKK